MTDTILRKTAYFISDAHLGIRLNGCEEREKHLISFLRQIRDDAAHLVIAGDLFDFWIEYRHAVRPDYFPVLHELKHLTDAGVAVHYCAGNHDFALGPFLQESIGLNISFSHLDLTLQGKRIRLCHGDGVLPSDHAYRFWRRFLRNPLNQKMFKWLHPDLGIPFAGLFSGSSRYLGRNKYTEKRREAYLRAARGYLDNGADIAIMGHTHHPELYNIDGKVYCNLGEWMRAYTYATLVDGKLSLMRYRPGHSPEALQPLPVKRG